jgi:hypothetical protein
MNGIAYISAAAGGIIMVVGLLLIIRSCVKDSRDDAEAVRRSNGYLVQDLAQAKALQRQLDECRERMGKECCLHPEYRFDERHQLVNVRK